MFLRIRNKSGLLVVWRMHTCISVLHVCQTMKLDILLSEKHLLTWRFGRFYDHPKRLTKLFLGFRERENVMDQVSTGFPVQVGHRGGHIEQGNVVHGRQETSDTNKTDSASLSLLQAANAAGVQNQFDFISKHNAPFPGISPAPAKGHPASSEVYGFNWKMEQVMALVSDAMTVTNWCIIQCKPSHYPKIKQHQTVCSQSVLLTIRHASFNLQTDQTPWHENRVFTCFPAWQSTERTEGDALMKLWEWITCFPPCMTGQCFPKTFEGIVNSEKHLKDVSARCCGNVHSWTKVTTIDQISFPGPYTGPLWITTLLLAIANDVKMMSSITGHWPTFPFSASQKNQHKHRTDQPRVFSKDQQWSRLGRFTNVLNATRAWTLTSSSIVTAEHRSRCGSFINLGFG